MSVARSLTVKRNIPGQSLRFLPHLLGEITNWCGVIPDTVGEMYHLMLSRLALEYMFGVWSKIVATYWGKLTMMSGHSFTRRMERGVSQIWVMKYWK